MQNTKVVSEFQNPEPWNFPRSPLEKQCASMFTSLANTNRNAYGLNNLSFRKIFMQICFINPPTPWIHKKSSLNIHIY